MTERKAKYNAIPHKMTFADALSLEIYGYIGNIVDMTPADVAGMLTRAAAACLGRNVGPGPVSKRFSMLSLRREYAPDDNLACRTIVDFGDGDILLLLVEDVKLLRALLLSWDEDRPAQVGDPLDMPTRLADGRVVSEVVAEMLDGEGE